MSWAAPRNRDKQSVSSLKKLFLVYWVWKKTYCFVPTWKHLESVWTGLFDELWLGCFLQIFSTSTNREAGAHYVLAAIALVYVG